MSNTNGPGSSGGPVGPTGGEGGQIYVVQPGDCLDSIGFANGFTWQTLWNLPANAPLKRQRDSPFTLLPGDRVFIPDLRVKQHSGAANARHSFQRKGVPSRLKVTFKYGNRPRAGEPLRLDIDGAVTQLVTDGNGTIDVPISPGARRAVARFGLTPDAYQTYELTLGAVDPIGELTGVQGRLSNLGYSVATTGQMDEDTQAAIVAFQMARQIKVTGTLDGPTIDALVEAHAS